MKLFFGVVLVFAHLSPGSRGNSVVEGILT